MVPYFMPLIHLEEEIVGILRAIAVPGGLDILPRVSDAEALRVLHEDYRDYAVRLVALLE